MHLLLSPTRQCTRKVSGQEVFSDQHVPLGASLSKAVSEAAPCLNSLITTEDSFSRQGTKDIICSTMLPNLDSSACFLNAVEPTQHHDMACFIMKGKRSADDDSRGKLSPASSERSTEQGPCRTAVGLGIVSVASNSSIHSSPKRATEVDNALLQLENLEITSDVELSKADCSKAIAKTLDDITAAAMQQQSQTAPQDTDQAAPADDYGADTAAGIAEASMPSNCVFFARVPPTVPYESIHALFSQFGAVLNLNLFRPWASAKTSKGCGLVEYASAACAVAAMDALHTKYHWTGGETTMVVEWMDPARHRKDKQLDDGSAQFKAPNNARNAKNNRKKNGKQDYSCLAPVINSMMPPSVAGWLIPPIRTTPLQHLAAGVPAAGFCYDSPMGQQTNIMMGVGADGMCRRATYPGCITGGNQLGGATGISGCGSHLTMDGSVSQFDAPLLSSLGYSAANMQAAAIPAQWAYAQQGMPAAGYSSMTGTPTFVAATPSPSQSWAFFSQPLDVQLQGLAHMTAHVGTPDRASPAAQNMASMLLQRQHQQHPRGWSALVPAGMPGDGSPGAGCYAGTDASLHQLLGNMGAPDGALGDLNPGLGGCTPGVNNMASEAAVSAAAGMQYLAHLQNRLEAIGTGHPASSYCSADCGGGSCGTLTPTAADAAANSAATANWLLSSGASHGAPLQHIVTGRRSFASEGPTSGNESLMGTGTPTYYQQAPGQGGSSLNPGGVTPSTFNSSLMMASNTGTPTVLAEQQLVGVTSCAGGGGFSAGMPMLAGQMPGSVDAGLLQLMYGMPAGGNASNLLAADGRAWAGM